MPPLAKTIRLLAIFLIPLFCFSQQTQQYIYTHFKTTDGLASTIINNAVQDHKGYIWLSTINGLQRYDGNKFLTFRNDKNNPSSLPTDDITFVYEDQNKNLWVLTSDNRAGIFNTSNFTFKEIPIRFSKSPAIFLNKQFIETSDGKLLLRIFGENTLYRYSPATNEFVPDKEVIPFPSKWKINHITQDPKTKNYWLASDSGLAVFNPVTKYLSYEGNNRENNNIIRQYGKERFIKYVHIDNKERVFFEQQLANSHPALWIVDPLSNNSKQLDLSTEYQLTNHEIKALLEQKNGRIWLYGQPFMAEIKDVFKEPLQFIRKDVLDESGIKFNTIYSLYEDRDQNVWVCTDNGLYAFNPDAHYFKNYYLDKPAQETPIPGRVQSLLQLNDKSIWLGTIDLGLFCYDEEFNPIAIPSALEPYQKNNSIWQLYQHSRTGAIWLAMGGGKFVVYNPTAKTVRLLEVPVFEKAPVTQIAEDEWGNLWMSTYSGLIVRWQYHETGEEANDQFTLVKKTEKVHKLIADKQGFIWAATFGQGLMQIDPGTSKVIRQFSKKGGTNTLWSNRPTDVLQYNDSIMVVASDAINLIDVRNNQVKSLSSYDGLPSNTTLNLVRDLKGIIWVGMVNGLCRVNLERNSFISYDRNDGILDDNFNLGGSYILSDGRLVFTSEENFLVFDPSKLQGTHTATRPLITDFKISNASFPVDSLLSLDRINLRYNQNSISIEFNTLNYNKLNKQSYYYQLEGLDDEWIKSDDRHQAIYNYLPPGDYIFRVKTKNADGSFNPDTTTLFIKIYPPFWKAWWFYGVLIFLIAAVLLFLDKERAKRLAALQKVRTEIATQIHEDIITTLNNINLLSQIAKLKADRDIEKSKEFIEQIGEKSQSMAVAMDDMLWSIDPRNDSMEKTLLRVVEFTESLENQYKIHLDIIIDEKLKKLELDMKVRYEFLLIFKDAIRCLIQYVDCQKLLINIDLVKTKVLLKILSQGCEIDPNGEVVVDAKAKMERRVKEINASLDFDVNKDQTSIVLVVPLLNQNK